MVLCVHSTTTGGASNLVQSVAADYTADEF